MLLTKNAVRNRINKYKAVLANCQLLNIFGTLALVIATPSVALAALAPLTAEVVDVVGVEVNRADPWVSSNNIAISNTSGIIVGIMATGKTHNVTLQSTHTLAVTNEGLRVKAYGIYGIGRDATNTFANAGSMSVMTKGDEAKAYGMWGNNGKLYNTFSNAKSMCITAEGDSVKAYGMHGVGITNSFTNSGSMNVTATGHNSNIVDAYGMWASGGEATNTFTNVNTITVTADGTGFAYGMTVDGGNANIFSNSGTMIVTVIGTGTAYGMRGSTKSNTFSNTGTLTVTASDNRTAYGMYVIGESTLHNTGTITVSGGTAYQAYVKGGTAHISTWALKLGETYGAAGSGYHVFGVGNGATLVFSDGGGKGATLIITGKGDAFVEGTEYAISDMVDIASATSSPPSMPHLPSKPSGTATGYIANVTSSYAFLEVELVDKGTASDYTDQYIKGAVKVTDDNSPSQAVTTQTVSGMRNNLNQLRNIVDGQTRATGERLDFSKRSVGSEAQSSTATMYADACTSLTDASNLRPTAPIWKTFLTPYYSQYGANNGTYDGHVHGIAMGATRQIGKDFALGAHFGLSQGSSDSALTDTDATTYTLGAHVVYSLGEALYFRGQVSGFMAENTIDMLGSSVALTRANTNMGTAGVYAMLAAGYDIVLAPEHFLTPELGLSYFYAHMDGFSTDFYNTGAGTKDAAISMASESYGVWYADATLRWTGTFAMDKGVLKPTVRAGVRHALTDPEVSSTMRFGSVKATTYSDANDTALLCEAGLAWEYDGITLSATYSGEFGDVEYSHMGMFKAEWAF